MGHAGAQREPSMEEILASIRRIIENNEPADVEADAAVPETASDGPDESEATDVFAAEAPSEPEQEDVDVTQPAARDVSADEPETGMPEMYPAAQDHVASGQAVVSNSDEDAAEPVSLADVAARVRGNSDQEPGSAAAETEVEDQDPNAVIDDAIAAELRQALVSNEPVSASQPAQVSVPTGSPGTSKPEPAPESADTVQEVASQPVPSLEPAPAVRAKPLAAPATPEPDDARGQLVSLHTGEKVAAAFNELTAAIEAGQARSFDDIAQDMLRPMLTQWLDDNLPTLVERLVREEIERVSRGDRR